MSKKKIFASEERRMVLLQNGVNFSVDDELNFVFPSEADSKKAVKVLKGALCL